MQKTETPKEKNIKRVVYASSSSVYGDNTVLPKVEDKTGNVLLKLVLLTKTKKNINNITIDIAKNSREYLGALPKKNIFPVEFAYLNPKSENNLKYFFFTPRIIVSLIPKLSLIILNMPFWVSLWKIPWL